MPYGISPIGVVCGSGYRSSVAASVLARRGHTMVAFERRVGVADELRWPWAAAPGCSRLPIAPREKV